jgi:phosphoribosylformylglycinamidine synthase
LTRNIARGAVLKIPIAHAEGRYYCDEATLKSLEANDQILFKYCDEDGNITESANVNGSQSSIAGICNASRNVFGMMPHPERSAEKALGNYDGRAIFESIVENVLA